MGNYAIKVEAVGGHGCGREAKEGEDLKPCGGTSCPDCIAARFIDELKAMGSSVTSATLTHWPGDPSEVVDDLLTKKRQRGNF